MKKIVSELAEITNGNLIGTADIEIKGVTNIDNPAKGLITFVTDEKTLNRIEKSEVSCILVPNTISKSSKTIIQCESPKLAFAKLLSIFNPPRQFSAGISDKTDIQANAEIGKNVRIEAFVSIGENAKIGDNVVIRSGCSIDKNTIIGSGTILHPSVTIYENTTLGKNVIIHSGTVIGSDGFGYTRNEKGDHVKLPQIGNVIIEDEVEIGANCCVDCATFGSTIIGKGTKLDNLVQVAHNVVIGRETAISGHAGVAGSSKIGNYVTIAAQVGIADHCTLDDGVILGGQTGVPSKKHLRKGLYMGTPPQPIEKFAKTTAMINRLPKLVARVKEIRNELDSAAQ